MARQIKNTGDGEMPEQEQLHHTIAELQQELDRCTVAKDALAQYEQILSTTSDHISILGCDYRYQAVSHSYLEAHRQSKEQIVGHTVAELLGQDTFERLVKPNLDRCFTGEIVNYQAWFEFAGCGRRYMDVTYFPCFEGAAVPRIVVSSHDITALHEAQACERMAHSVFENTSEAIVITDAEANIVDVNPAYCELTGYAREEVLGKNPRFAQSGHHDQAFFRDMWNSLNQHGRWQGEIWDRRKNGEIFPKLMSINAIKDEAGLVVKYVGLFSDISVIKDMQEQLQQLAYYDPLTKLPNRALFRQQLQRELAIAERYQRRFAVLFIDLDHFKYVNDSLGHSVGDQLLAKAASRLRDCLRTSDFVSRFGGDEFTAILVNPDKAEQVAGVAQTIIDRLSQPFSIAGRQLYIGASIGIFLYPDNGQDLENILRQADTAMYHAKECGKGCYKFCTDELNARVNQRVALDADLHRALKRGEFSLHYQPQLDAHSGRVIAVEALLRWQHPQKGLLCPQDFLPLAEETGIIIPIGEWVLRQACAQAKAWQDGGQPSIPVAVNLSARQFRRRDLAETIGAILSETGLAGEYLELEVSETVAMADPEISSSVFERLTHLGVKLAIDNFGSGYSSLSHLKRFPLDKLKIDLSLIHGIETDDQDITAALIGLAKTLHLNVVAEGVEKKEQQALLLGLGCNLMQGYLFQRPQPAETL